MAIGVGRRGLLLESSHTAALASACGVSPASDRGAIKAKEDSNHADFLKLVHNVIDGPAQFPLKDE
jgi:hypothetical protein